MDARELGLGSLLQVDGIGVMLDTEIDDMLNLQRRGKRELAHAATRNRLITVDAKVELNGIMRRQALNQTIINSLEAEQARRKTDASERTG